MGNRLTTINSANSMLSALCFMCLCFGLSASLEETQELLRLCGLAELYPKVRRDAIIIYGLLHGMDLFAVNDRLFSEDEETLF